MCRLEETSVNEPEEASKPKRKRRTKAEIEQEELEEEEQYRKWVQTFADLLKGVPKELWFGMFLSWLWAQTHGSHIPNKGDLVLGLLGGFTLPHALRAGTLSAGSIWAAAYLTSLGYNYFDDIIGDIEVDVDATDIGAAYPWLFTTAAVVEAAIVTGEQENYRERFMNEGNSAGGQFYPGHWLQFPAASPPARFVFRTSEGTRLVPFYAWITCVGPGNTYDWTTFSCNIPEPPQPPHTKPVA